MVLLSGMTDSAVTVVFVLLFGITLVSYLIVYKILMLWDQLRALLTQLKANRPPLFYISHVLIYFFSILVLSGVMAFYKYIFQ